MFTKKESFYTPGKIMLTGEYLVLNGARALAVPLRLGQQMDVLTFDEPQGVLDWTSEDVDGEFFSARFSSHDLSVLDSNDAATADYISTILQGAKNLNFEFLNPLVHSKVHSVIEFSRQYGFGSSSSLICNIAKWAKIDALALNKLISNGSGYDVATGMMATPILFQLINEKPEVYKVNLSYSFTDKFWLVYLGHKQSTTSAIANYQPNHIGLLEQVKKLNAITHRFLENKTLSGFQKSMRKHEKCIAEVLDRKRIKKELFSDFNGEIKSLGAWGGDFVLAVSQDAPLLVKQYFSAKGYDKIFAFTELVILDN